MLLYEILIKKAPALFLQFSYNADLKLIYSFCENVNIVTWLVKQKVKIKKIYLCSNCCTCGKKTVSTKY